MEPERKQQPNGNFKKVVTKKRAIMFSALYFVSTMLLLLAASNIFTESPFNKRFTVLYIMMFANTFFLMRIWKLYLKQQRENSK